MNEKNSLNLQWLLRPERKKVYWFESAFTDEEIEKIKQIAGTQKLAEAEVLDKPNFENVRKSSVSWIGASPETEWLFKKIVDYTLYVNSINFNLNIVGIEPLQFTVYESSVKGFYATHTDVFSQARNFLNRKLSFSIQLSDPSEYEGGELIIEPINELIEAKKQKGSITFFESTERHQVCPVTNGMRMALVGWVDGPPVS